ncbi:MAG: hypothetical protein WAZ98_10130 [Cyclobacteriaceae bacterium]
MKKSFSVFVVLMVMGSVVLAGGIENPLMPSNMAITKTISGARVIYQTEKPSSVLIKIYDGQDQEVFSDVVKSNESFSRVYNLTNMPEGIYRVSMEDENGKREETFNTHKKIELLSSVIHSKKLNKCLVTLYSQGTTEAKITLKDDNRNVLAADNFTVNGQSVRLFNLEKVNGPVYVEVSDKNGVIRSSVIQ